MRFTPTGKVVVIFCVLATGLLIVLKTINDERNERAQYAARAARIKELAEQDAIRTAAIKQHNESMVRLRQVDNRWCVIPESRLPMDPGTEAELLRTDPWSTANCFADESAAQEALDREVERRNTRLRKVGNRWCVVPKARMPMSIEDEVYLSKSDCFATKDMANNVFVQEYEAEAPARAAEERKLRHDVCMEGAKLLWQLGKITALEASRSCDDVQ